ncbi:MAG: DNA mismatch repair protein MutS [Thermoflexales bacterium]|nr:DNA mismatch repair protein MutS [Thermoflexales bacterium]
MAPAPLADATPIRRQYLELKAKHPDCILFFRLGDFYETFDADAELIARELGVTLTSRPVGKDVRVPLAGVPHHAVEGYLARLIERGYRVAMADQIGDEAVNGLVPREIRRVVTPGTVVEPRMLEAGQANYLAALVGAGSGGPMGLAYCDITTGEFMATQLDSEIEVERELARVRPRELLVPEESAFGAAEAATRVGPRPNATPYPAYRFEIGNARQAVLGHYKVGSLHGFGLDEQPQALRAVGGILAYLREMQPAALRQLGELRSYSTARFMALDAVTRRNLEVSESLRGRGKQGSLLGVLDRTETPMGARLLRAWLAQPLLDRAEIEQRLTRVDAFYGDALLREKSRDGLRGLPDLERLATRIVGDLATPKELLNLRDGLRRYAELPAAALACVADESAGDGLAGRLEATVGLITAAIRATDAEGESEVEGFIRPGYSAELDGIAQDARVAKAWVANLERVERERTGIKSLKVGYNKVFGYYLEITHANRDAAPADYIRKQTLTNAERYITPQLKEYETLILNADGRIAELERGLLVDLRQKLSAYAKDIMLAAGLAARVDVAMALADVAARNGYTRPTLTDEDVIEIVDGRHPVIEQLLAEIPFTPNDCRMDADARILVITGPNMSGKSSYMRQIALICLLAQIGAYVPARAARLRVVDRIFTRIGAQDELTAGQSTFMVEMVETAAILRHCTPRSLVVLDEIGRGTSTYDGLAIAWSVIEFLHNHPDRRAFTLFATHYHELIKLADRLPHVRNLNVAVSDEAGEVVFLHKVVDGGADRSYGIHVAQLAGIPSGVLHRAQDILRDLEEGKGRGRALDATRRAASQTPSLFAPDSPALARLRELDPNALSPIEALTALFELKKLI